MSRQYDNYIHQQLEPEWEYPRTGSSYQSKEHSGMKHAKLFERPLSIAEQEENDRLQDEYVRWAQEQSQ